MIANKLARNPRLFDDELVALHTLKYLGSCAKFVDKKKTEQGRPSNTKVRPTSK